MSGEIDRTRRVGEQIRRDLSELIRDEIRDPRLGMVTINHVKVSRDLSHARVYVTVMGDEAAREQSLAVLNKAAGFLRGQIGRRMKIRVVPQLRFMYDEAVERGAQMEALLRKLHDTSPSSADGED